MSTPVDNPVLTKRTFLDALTEAAWGDGGSGTALLIPMMDAEYSVAPEDPVRYQQHVNGDADAQYPVLTGRKLAGDLKVGAWPHNWATILAYAVDRDANNEVASKTFRWTTPGVETVEHLGMKVDKLTIESQAEGDVSFTLGLIGWYERQRSGGILTYPASYVIPDIPSLQHKSLAFVASLNAGTTFANQIVPRGVQSFTLTLENMLKAGRAIENRITVEKDGAIEFLTTGARKLSIKWTGIFDRDDFSTLQRKRYYTQLKILGAHDKYTSYATVGAIHAAGSAAVILVDSSASFVVGDVVLFDAAGSTSGSPYMPCVGTVSAITDGTHITIDVLDSEIKVGDHVFNAALELKTERALVGSMPKGKPYDDYVTVEINAEVFTKGTAPLAYKAKNNTLPA